MIVAAIADGADAVKISRRLSGSVRKCGGDVGDHLRRGILEIARRRFLQLVVRAVDDRGPAHVVRRSALHLSGDTDFRTIGRGARCHRLANSECRNRR